MVEEHLKQAGAGRARGWPTSGRARRSGRSGCASCSTGWPRSGAIVAVDREWFIHRAASDRLRGETLGLLEAFHAENPLRGGISREELRSRAGNAQERVFAQLLGALEAEGVVKSERDQVRLASHAIRLSPEQQRVVDGVEADFRRRRRDAARAPRRRWAAWA